MSEEPTQLHPADDDEVIDLDLDAEESRVREAIGKPTTVRVDGTIIHIDHAAGWTTKAMRAATSGDWDTWAAEVIEDEKELSNFLDANLLNAELEAIFTACGKAGRISMGKSSRSARSSRGMRRR